MDNRIAHLRRMAGLSQAALAEMIGTKLTMLGKLERGERDLTSQWIGKLTQALKVDVSALFVAPKDEAIAAGFVGPGGRVYDDGSSGKATDVWKSPDKRSYYIDQNPLAISLPTDSWIIVDPSLGGPLSDELTNCLAVIEIEKKHEDDDTHILGVVMRPSGGNAFFILPCGGTPMENSVIRRINPVVSIELRTP